MWDVKSGVPQATEGIEHRVASRRSGVCSAATKKHVPSGGTAFAGGGDAFLERTRERKCVTPSIVPTAGCCGDGAASLAFRLSWAGLSFRVSGEGQRRLPALDGLVSVTDWEG